MEETAGRLYAADLIQGYACGRKETCGEQQEQRHAVERQFPPARHDRIDNPLGVRHRGLRVAGSGGHYDVHHRSEVRSAHDGKHEQCQWHGGQQGVKAQRAGQEQNVVPVDRLQETAYPYLVAVGFRDVVLVHVHFPSTALGFD